MRGRPIHRSAVWALCLTSAFIAAGCGSTRVSLASNNPTAVQGATSTTKPSSAASPSANDVAGGKETAKPDAEDKTEKLAKKQRDLSYAELELAISRQAGEAEAREARDAVREAERGLEESRRELDAYLKVDKELALARSQLGLERAAWAMEAETQELRELQVMYQEEQIATLTKELVLQRGQKGLEFATKALEMETRESVQLREYELPRKQRDFEQKIAKGERGLMEARAKADRGELERQLRVLKAEHACADLQREIAKLEKELAAARKGEAPSSAAPSGGTKPSSP
ncbi:MAG: hypothetical protein ACKVX7_15050 [Planctomycetota bacterium]